MKTHYFDNKEHAVDFIEKNYDAFLEASWSDDQIDGYDVGWYVTKDCHGDWTNVPGHMGVYNYDIESIDDVIQCLPKDPCKIRVNLN